VNDTKSNVHFIFPKWTGLLRPAIVIAAGGGLLYVGVVVTFGFSPRTTDVGYQPEQPAPYSHALHVGQLGMDCRYCHTTVEEAAFAALPPTQTCMNCHARVRAQSDRLIPVRESLATGQPVRWVKVHDLPDYVYFNHSAHVRRGVGCGSCHGRVDTFEVVRQVELLSMGWCLGCHREPERYLRPPEVVTKLDWAPGEEQLALGRRLRAAGNVNPSTDCTTCHR
jgi:hypothetical protein